MSIGLVDAGLVTTFAVIVGLDALTRVPAGHVMFQRLIGADWRASQPEGPTRWRFIGPFSPICAGFVVEWSPNAPISEVTFARRLERVTAPLRALVALGVSHLALLILGVPWCVAYWGGAGLIMSLALVVCSGALITVVAARAVRHLEVRPTRGRIAQILRWGSPFSAAAAAQDVLQLAAQGVPAVVVSRVLMRSHRFESWIRPFAWDYVEGPDDATVMEAIGDRELRRIVSAAPACADGMAASYCPRCETLFAILGTCCPDCQLQVRPLERSPR